MANEPSKKGAEAAGKARAAGKAITGHPGIFKHLMGEHLEVAGMMKRVAASGEDSDVREELFPEILKNLLAHAKAEEGEFYPELQNHPETREFVERALEQHERVEGYLDELASGNKHTKTWTELFQRMQRAVEEHVDFEENTVFPKAEEVISKEEAQDLEERYEEAEEEVLQQL